MHLLSADHRKTSLQVLVRTSTNTSTTVPTIHNTVYSTRTDYYKYNISFKSREEPLFYGSPKYKHYVFDSTISHTVRPPSSFGGALSCPTTTTVRTCIVEVYSEERFYAIYLNRLRLSESATK
jgi:hypothetical protein